MEVFVARQPIFDNKIEVVAYELLYRNGMFNRAEPIDDNQATTDVLTNVFLQMGIDTIAEGKRAFVNFNEALLLQQVPHLLPSNILAVEILETVIPSEALLQACKKLKQEGYWLVLDDFLPAPEWLPLAKIADIIKVDFKNPQSLEAREYLLRHDVHQPEYLAEKIETKEEFMRARKQGYSFFQGYFFQKPIILSQKEMPLASIQHLRLLKELYAENVDLRRFEEIVKRDMSLSFLLLKYVNSAFFSFRSPIQSIRHAAALLGQRELAKWLALVTLRNLGEGQPSEVLHVSVLRGRHCELIAACLPQCRMAVEQFFFVGLFSLLDVFIGKSLADILEYLPVAEEVKQALLGGKNALNTVLNLVIAYERGQWWDVQQYCDKLRLPYDQLAPTYISAICWEQELFRKDA
ncbi:EAL and HDOD domain-containing protein [Anaeroarcus burkinensis]|uniref:EAL and HDOD domain-containing protein n=1 Tax=Anaeroarcus burkinensis TaxID=82376 RepID=UPI0003FCEC54|nr:HDOD domain-containing protein [Anaeroarcus burkinensis]